MPRAFYPPTKLAATCGHCGRAISPAEEREGKCGGCGHGVRALIGMPIPCVGCGYDLRGSPQTCPECGMSVASSLAQVRQASARRVAWRNAARPAGWGAIALIAGVFFFYQLYADFYDPITSSRLATADGQFRENLYRSELIAGSALTVVGVVGLARARRVFVTSRIGLCSDAESAKKSTADQPR
jgi:hypothetical protein